MIYTDGIHLMSDTSVRELHNFVIFKLGFNRNWFQDHSVHPHYDLTTENARQRAIRAGAELVSSKELIKKCGRRRK